MKSFMIKARTAAATVGLFALGAVMAGLGLAFMGVLALFGFAALAIGLVAAPFLALGPQPDAAVEADAEPVAA